MGDLEDDKREIMEAVRNAIGAALNTVIGIQCSDNGSRVQSGNDQSVGANVAGLGAPYSYFYANTPATSVKTSCYITGK
jgi:hypothetical protein